MLNSKDFNFSFSGLKTAVLYLVRGFSSHREDKHLSQNLRSAIAAEFQQAAVDVLVKKTIRAAQEYKVKTILLGGGVSANKFLRERLAGEIKNLSHVSCLMSPVAFAGDKALMIATAAYFCGKPRISTSAAAKGGENAIAEVVLRGKKKAQNKVRADANLKLGR